MILNRNDPDLNKHFFNIGENKVNVDGCNYVEFV